MIDRLKSVKPSLDSEIDARVDRQLRGLALGAWVHAMVPVRAQVAAVNVGFGELVSAMARRVAAL